MSVYTEEDTKILFSILKREKPNRDSINFRNKNDSNYKINYNSETMKLLDLNKYNLLILNSDNKKQILNFKSSPRLIIYSLLCLETSSFTTENSKILRSFIKEFINRHYNYSILQDIYNSRKNVNERIEVFMNSKNDFSDITNTIINYKEDLSSKITTTSNPKKIKKLEALKEKFNPLNYTSRFVCEYQD